MREILISIRPQWVEKILNGEKTIEIRKTKPKCELPVKVYIYRTKSRIHTTKDMFLNIKTNQLNFLNGKVVAEFTLNKVDEFACKAVPYVDNNNLGYEKFIDNGVYKIDVCSNGIVFERNDKYLDTMLKNSDFEKMCLTPKELYNYGKYQTLYAWHISDLKVYDTPRELGEFKRFCGNNGQGCPDSNCPYYEEPSYEYGEVNHDCDFMKPLTTAPKSWCYVEGESL